MEESSSAKKRVFIYAPFSEKHTGARDNGDFDNPNFSVEHWAAVRNRSPAKSAKKNYIPVHGPDEFNQIAFQTGDRVYVHAHGGDWGEIFARGGKVSGKEQVDVDMHTPASLWDSLNSNKTFASLGQSASSPLDLRIAACHSGDAKSFNAQLSKVIRKRKGRYVNLKGKVGEFSANTGSLTSRGTGRPSSKGLTFS